MRRIFVIVLAMLLSALAFAQKKALDEARTNIKKGTNLEAVENSMRNLLKDSANLNNEKIWLTLFDAVKKQYEQLNEKLYLQQRSDTSKLFTHTKHMYDVLESLDSVDVKNTHGKPDFRKKHAAYLDKYRQNLFNGGAFYVMKQEYAEAVGFFERYIDCANQPLFSSYDYMEKDEEKMIDAAYWLTFCGYKLQNPSLVDRYSDLALRDASREVYTLQYIAESAMLKGDDLVYQQVLEQGFTKYPSNAYFFPHLANLYVRFALFKEIIDICEKMLELEPENIEALSAYSTALYESKRYDHCIEVSDRLIALDSTIARVYLNAGLSYYFQVKNLYDLNVPTKAQRQQLADVSKKALPYLERYRELVPDDTEAYALPLYNIYLTLNMGEGFEEMERILYGE